MHHHEQVVSHFAFVIDRALQVQSKLRLSEPCANCVSKLAACGRANCKWKCLFNTHGEQCKACTKQHCQGDFWKCAQG